ncbi:MAG: phytanoyl-CoA dioxygenase family protein [Actinomycetota bacterium]
MHQHPTYPPDHEFRVLTREQWEFWRANGYLVVPGVAPVELCDRVAEMLWRFLDADPEDPSTWYELAWNRPDAPSRRGFAGMLEVYHDAAMWEIRQHPRVYDTFVDLWGTEELWITLDRANINVPATDEWDFEGFLHWDIDPQPGAAPAEIQGIIALADTTAEMGGLQVVPEAFQRYDELAAEQIGVDRPRFPDVTGMEVVKVECGAGDLVVWESCTVHGTGRNVSDRPRLAQYLTMAPATPDDTEMLDLRLQSFRDRTGYFGNSAFRGDPRELEVATAPTLTDLGERLLGSRAW